MIPSSENSATSAAVKSAREVLRRHMEALNARDQPALVATLHFPHHRLTARGLQTWTTPDGYLADFLARAGDGWARSAWNFVSVVAASSEKVHLDVEFTRYRADGSEIGRYRSLWVITRDGDRWAAALRSSFAG